MAGRRSPWLEGRVDVLLAALAEYSMSVSRASAAELISDRVQAVAAQLHVTPVTARRYFTDDTLQGLAREMVVPFASEAPGGDLFGSPRTAAVPLPVLGRCIAGLAEAIELRLGERDDLEHVRRATSAQTPVLSALGQVLAESTDAAVTAERPGEAAVMMPPALLHRAARYLEVAASLVRQEGLTPEGIDPADAPRLADTFEADALSARFYADGS